MSDHTQKWILHQIRYFRNNTCSAPVLPFSEILVPELVNAILQELHITFRERLPGKLFQLLVQSLWNSRCARSRLR